MKHRRSFVPLASLVVSLALLAARPLRGQAHPDSVTAWFRDAKVGLFVHWGIYSVLADGEWVQNNRSIRSAEYEGLAPLFNPARFDAAQWVDLARRAGARYLVMTTKHHDGFAMFDSKLTDWDIADRTPFRRDVIGELAAACRAGGLPLMLYYSQLDWHHPDYFPRGGTGRQSGRPEAGDFNRYLAFMDGQLEELLTRYGPVAGVWFDGMWDNGAVDWRLDRTYGLIKRLQPRALIVSNHNDLPHRGEDYVTYEGFIRPRAFPPGADYPAEVSEKINDTWGFRVHDTQYKSSRDLIRKLVTVAGAGANYLINVGPMADGTIQPEFVDRLTAVGQWLSRYGRSIYGTRAGPVGARPWGVTTARGDTVFVHLLDWADPVFPLTGLGRTVRSARYVGRDGRPTLTALKDGVVLGIAPAPPSEPDLVIELVLEPARR